MGMLELSIIITIIVGVMLLVQDYLERKIKRSTQNFTDAILDYEPKKDEDVGTRVQQTATSMSQTVAYSKQVGTKEHKSFVLPQETTTTVAASAPSEQPVYMEIIPAKRGFVKPIRMKDITKDDDYERQIFPKQFLQ